MDEDDDNGDEKESDDNALSITQGKCHPANMQRASVLFHQRIHTIIICTR